MQYQPLKKQHRRPLPPLLIVGLLLALAGALLLPRLLPQPAVPPVETQKEFTNGVLMAHTADEVMELTIRRRDEAAYTLTKTDSGWSDATDASTELNTETVALMAETLAAIGYENILSEDYAADALKLADFGLETPRLAATVRYSDRQEASLRFGDRIAGSEDNLRYLMIEGDPRLYAIDSGTMDTLSVSRAALTPIPQPVLHGTRMDSIRLTKNNAVYAAWELSGSITDASAAWELTYPARYPADEQAMSRLRKNIENIRLGAFVAKADENTLKTYGFEQPRMSLTVHMAAGATYVSDAESGVVPYEWQESSFTLTIGGSLDDLIDYALVDGSIYRISRFQTDLFVDYDPLVTASRYPVTIPFAYLTSMTITENGQTTRYVVRHDETGVFPYAGLATDDRALSRYPYGLSAEQLNAVTRSHKESTPALLCLKNGCYTDANALKAAYVRLINVTVSGALPEGWQPTGEATATYRLTGMEGDRLDIALYPYDALHDAVSVNGVALFYLIRGGMSWGQFV